MSVAPIIPERQFRGPGCTDACEIVRAIVPGRFGRTELLLHDPSAHERYGWVMAGVPGSPTAVLTIGPLALDRDRGIATVDGEQIHVTPREFEILSYLALRRGRVCPTSEIAAAIWSGWHATNTPRVILARIRQRLGGAAWVLQTKHGFGYTLDERPLLPLPAGPLSWTSAWEACVCCGRRDRNHYGHGRCMRCRFRPGSYRQHYGPCGAPPAPDLNGVEHDH